MSLHIISVGVWFFSYLWLTGDCKMGIFRPGQEYIAHSFTPDLTELPVDGEFQKHSQPTCLIIHGMVTYQYPIPLWAQQSVVLNLYVLSRTIQMIERVFESLCFRIWPKMKSIQRIYNLHRPMSIILYINSFIVHQAWRQHNQTNWIYEPSYPACRCAYTFVGLVCYQDIG